MEIRQLKYFVEICRCKSFSQAAKICYISPQGVSMSMMRLEEELGKKLFTRSTMGIALTPHAEFLLPKAKKILAISEECEAYFNSDKAEEAVIPIYCSHGTIEEFAGTALREFENAHPELRITIHECSDIDADEALLSDECEIALTVGPLPENRFDEILLKTSEYGIIVKDTDPLAKYKSISIEQLKGLQLAVMYKGIRTYPFLHSLCAKYNFEPTIHTYADNVLLIYYMATQPGMYGITTEALYRRLNPPGLSFVKIAYPGFIWKSYAIKRKGADLSAPVELLWQLLLTHKSVEDSSPKQTA